MTYREDRHSHPFFGKGPLEHRPHLEHEHDRGFEGHTHTEEIEVVVARLLHHTRYTGLSPVGQAAVAAGIAAMRAHLVIALADNAADRLDPPTTGHLRAPLVTRQKGQKRKKQP